MKSSLKLIPQTAIGKEEEKKLSLIINSLYDNSDAFEFREPVDWKGMHVAI